MPKPLISSTLALVILAAVTATGINSYQSATATGVYEIAAAPKAKVKKAASGKCNPLPGNGTLEVRFGEDLPADAAGISVSITGPRRWSRAGVTPGRNYIYQRVPTGKYTVTVSGRAPRRFESHELIDTAFYLSADPLNPCVQKNGTSRVTVGYVPEPGSGKMWVGGGFSTQVLSIRPEQFETVDPAYDARIHLFYDYGSWAIYGSAMDPQGNLWVSLAGTSIVRIPMAKLGISSRGFTPDIQITSEWFRDSSPGNLAFDADGSLWVVNSYRNEVAKFSTNDLKSSGAKTPTVVMSGLDRPQGIALDRTGNLWIANDGLLNTPSVVRYNAARLNRSTNEAPDATLIGMRQSGEYCRSEELQNPGPLAFDQGGNLWVGYGGGSALVARYTPDEQSVGGSITPGRQIKVPLMTGMLAFDEQGNLWAVGGLADESVARYGAEQLESPAAPCAGDRITPSIIFKAPMAEAPKGAASLLMNPSPSWSPLNDR